jgi:hypothetical protein
MVYGGRDGGARWTRSELYGKHGEGFGAKTGRAVNGLVGTRGSLRGLAVRAVCTNVDIGGDSSTIDLLKFVNGRECLGKLHGCKEGGAR